MTSMCCGQHACATTPVFRTGMRVCLWWSAETDLDAGLWRSMACLQQPALLRVKQKGLPCFRLNFSPSARRHNAACFSGRLLKPWPARFREACTNSAPSAQATLILPASSLAALRPSRNSSPHLDFPVRHIVRPAMSLGMLAQRRSRGPSAQNWDARCSLSDYIYALSAMSVCNAA